MLSFKVRARTNCNGLELKPQSWAVPAPTSLLKLCNRPVQIYSTCNLNAHSCRWNVSARWLRHHAARFLPPVSLQLRVGSQHGRLVTESAVYVCDDNKNGEQDVKVVVVVVPTLSHSCSVVYSAASMALLIICQGWQTQSDAHSCDGGS